MKQLGCDTSRFIKVAIGAIFAFSFGLTNLVVVVKILSQEYSLVTLFDSLILGVLLIACSSFMFRTLCCTMMIDDEKISHLLFGRLRRVIRFEEIKEIGEGYVYTPDGKKKRFYISKEKLSDEEKNNLALAHFKCIYFSGFTKDFANELNKHIDYDLSPWIYKKK